MKKSNLFMILLLLVIMTPIAASGGAEAAPVVNDASDKVEFGENWWVSWKFYEDEIEFTMAAPTTGWVAIGFNPSRMMRDADFILAYVQDGQVFITDEYGTSNTGHKPDESLGGTDSTKVVSGEEVGQVTTVTFRLPLNSNDQYDVVFTQGSPYKMLVAYGGQGQDNFTSMHKGRSSANVTL